MNEFHIHVYGPRPDQADGAVQPGAIPTSFEAALDRLSAEIPESLVEYDGSIAWASPEHQLVGMIYDAGGAIQYIELRGRTDQSRLLRLVRVLSGEAEPGNFAVMVLPDRQWKDLQTFVRELP